MGSANTASGEDALLKNTTGDRNTGSGDETLLNNTTGNNNAAYGVFALFSNTAGSNNTANGFDALGSNLTGAFNIGIGNLAGSNIVQGSHNIEIGGAGTSDESNTIRIGTQGTQRATFIAGISGTAVTGADVVVSSSGQLGVATSSALYKRDIRDMGGAGTGLMKLRPVTFRYKNDPSGSLQYGLVPEEVARGVPGIGDPRH